MSQAIATPEKPTAPATLKKPAGKPAANDTAALTGAITITPAILRDNYAEHFATGLVTEEQFSMLEWLLTHGIDRRLSIAALGRASDLGEGTMSKLVNGVYGSGSMEQGTFKLIPIAGLVGKIEGYRELYEQRLAITKADFVETSIHAMIKAACDTALTYQTIYPIYGVPQTGKTTSLEKIRDTDKHGRVVFVEMPAMGRLHEFLVALNRALREPIDASPTRILNRPMEVLKGKHLLIIDEIHQTTVAPELGTARLDTIEYIRRLQDRTKCGLVPCGTNVFRDAVEAGKHFALLEQYRRRGLPPLQLPDMLPRRDMDAIAAAYGLPAAPDAIHTVRETLVKTTGLKAYVTFLKMGAQKASAASVKIAWSDFMSAHDVTRKLSRTTAEKEAAAKAAAGKDAQ